MKLRQMRLVTLASFTTTALALALTACGKPGPDYPIETAADIVEFGRPLYVRECASCHGDAVTRPPAPTAPTHQADGHTWHHPDRLLVEWVLDGVPAARLMPAFRGQLTEDEARAVIAFIKTFWPPQVRDQQARATEQYELQLAEDGR